MSNEVETRVHNNTAVASMLLAMALADSNTLRWPADQVHGRQGDVLIARLPDNDPRLDRAALEMRTQRVDRVVARGSRAAHTASDEATVYEDAASGGVLIVSASAWALVHLDSPGDQHFAHVLPAGAYLCTQQREMSPEGVESTVAD